MIEEPAMTAEPKPLEKGLMKAIVRERFGSPDVLQIKEVEKPAPNEVRGVLVKIYASSVNAADKHDMRGASLAIRLVGPLFRLSMGVRRPKEPGLGTDFAGVVETVRNDVTEFKPGDEVYGVANAAYAEYGLTRESRIALKPRNSSFEQSAAVPIAGFTALQALRDKGHVKPGDKKFTFFIAKSNHADLVVLKDLIERGDIIPVIDRRYRLADTAQAIRYFEEGRTQGKIVITGDHDIDKPGWSDSYKTPGTGTSR